MSVNTPKDSEKLVVDDATRRGLRALLRGGKPNSKAKTQPKAQQEQTEKPRCGLPLFEWIVFSKYGMDSNDPEGPKNEAAFLRFAGIADLLKHPKVAKAINVDTDNLKRMFEAIFHKSNERKLTKGEIYSNLSDDNWTAGHTAYYKLLGCKDDSSEEEIRSRIKEVVDVINQFEEIAEFPQLGHVRNVIRLYRNTPNENPKEAFEKLLAEVEQDKFDEVMKFDEDTIDRMMAEVEGRSTANPKQAESKQEVGIDEYFETHREKPSFQFLEILFKASKSGDFSSPAFHGKSQDDVLQLITDAGDDIGTFSNLGHHLNYAAKDGSNPIALLKEIIELKEDRSDLLKTVDLLYRTITKKLEK